MEVLILFLSMTIKLLLLKTKPSTDFDVHKNWKDITTSTTLDKWYFDERSIWTLDYPPLFSYFEYILGSIANGVQSLFPFIEININNSTSTASNNSHLLVFQKLTTILIGDLSMFFALKSISKHFRLTNYLLFFHILIFGGLLIVDHIHFQYNSFLYALFILSISSILDEKYVFSSIIYTVLLCFKHIFLYFAPAFFVFILKNHVLNESKHYNKLCNLIKVGASVILTLILSFLPFIYYSLLYNNSLSFQLIQILKRMFPTERGLVHTLWAPNFWAVYLFFDKILNMIGLKVYDNPLEAIGKVRKTNEVDIPIYNIEFKSLPIITPVISNGIVIGLSLIIMVKYLMKSVPNRKLTLKKSFLKLLRQSAFVFFYFGYHVHEKAIIGIGIVSLLIELDQKEDEILKNFHENSKDNISTSINPSPTSLLSFSYLQIDMICFIAQIGLIHEVEDYYTKFFICIIYFLVKVLLSKTSKKQLFFICFLYGIYLLLDFVYSIYIPLYSNKTENFIGKYVKKFEFLPLMLVSVMNSVHFFGVFVFYSWLVN